MRRDKNERQAYIGLSNSDRRYIIKPENLGRKREPRAWWKLFILLPAVVAIGGIVWRLING